MHAQLVIIELVKHHERGAGDSVTAEVELLVARFLWVGSKVKIDSVKNQIALFVHEAGAEFRLTLGQECIQLIYETNGIADLPHAFAATSRNLVRNVAVTARA